jgi:hypothetical protein
VALDLIHSSDEYHPTAIVPFGWVEVRVVRQQVVRGWVLALGLLALGGPRAMGQDEPEPLRFEGLYAAGARASLTEAWGTLQFSVENRASAAKLVRVVVFYPNRPELQFAREIWVPARARRTSWLSVGPAPEQPREFARELAYQLFDRTDGTDREVRGRDPARLLTRAVLYRRSEPTTALYIDSAVRDLTDPDPLEDPDSADSESLRLVHTFRSTRGTLSERVSIVREQYLPPSAEALDGIDHFVLAGNRLSADPVGQRALRHWVLNGGTLWVLLDRVDPAVVAPILGTEPGFRIVGRTGLTTLRMRTPKQSRESVGKREFDHPVELVRVALSGSETVLVEANDWPAAFSVSLGQGRVIFTTVSARGWYQPRTPRDPPSKFERVQDVPIATEAFDLLAWQLQPERALRAELPADDLAPLLRADIGYEVVGRRTAGLVLAAFLVGLVAVALALRRSKAPELIGFSAPVVAAVAAAALIIAGMSARRAVPPTAAAVAIVSVSPDNREERWHGLFAVYNPESGAVELSSRQGGRVDFDPSGLEGTRRWVETDSETWHWENLSFPAGVRVGPFHATGRSEVSASGRFGAQGLAGQLSTGSFRNPADAVLQTRTGALFTVQQGADGSFRVDPDGALPPNQFLPGTVLTDRQQRRQNLYRRVFADPKAEVPNQDRLFVWTEAGEIPFTVPGAERTVGSALVIVPIRYEAPEGGSVTVPGGFVPFVAVVDGRPHAPRLNHSEPARMRLRFQVPESVRPFTIERAVLRARVRAPARKFSVFGIPDGQPVPLLEQLAPADPIRLEITDPRLLRTDPDGGLFLELVVSERIGADGRERPVGRQEDLLKWEIEALGLDVIGHGTGK